MNKFFLYPIFLSGLFFLTSCGGKDNQQSTLSSSISADQILEEIYTLCEQARYNGAHPFCLTHNLRNLRQIIKPYLYKIKNSDSKKVICDSINDVFWNDLKISHFYLEQKEVKYSNKPNPSKIFIQPNYIHLKINDFEEGFNNSLAAISGLENAIFNKKGVIIDLRGNMGGQVLNLNLLYSYFFATKTILAYHINFTHEPFLGDLNKWIGDYSTSKMNDLINIVQSNWNLESNPWHIFSPIRESIIEKNIAILINKNSASCSEEFSMVLKTHFPTRVKIIGKKSYGALFSSRKQDLSHGLVLLYPTDEIIGINGMRIEGVGIEPDQTTNTEDETMNAAIDWVVQ